MIAGDSRRIGDEQEAYRQQIPKLCGREEIASFGLGAGSAADQLVEIAQLIPLVAEYLRDGVRHQSIFRIDTNIQHPKWLWLRAQPRDDGVVTIQRLVRRVRVQPETAAVAPQVRPH